MEPYCADITSEEVRTLEELLKPPEDEAEHYKVDMSLTVGTGGHRRRSILGSRACITRLLSSQPPARSIAPADPEGPLFSVP